MKTSLLIPETTSPTAESSDFGWTSMAAFGDSIRRSPNAALIAQLASKSALHQNSTQPPLSTFWDTVTGRA